jgi:5-methylcytosine-specific restriction endonuclease McrA
MYGRFELTSETTVREVIHWAYANLAMGHVAVAEGARAFDRKHYAIRAKYHKGLTTGTMKLGPFADEERLKLVLPRMCCYCGAWANLSLDHLVATHRGGLDEADNLVWSCRSCNSSKQANDLLLWYQGRGSFPPLLLLRRYLKLAERHCRNQGCLEARLTEVTSTPFELQSIPLRFPPPANMCIWVNSRDQELND